MKRTGLLPLIAMLLLVSGCGQRVNVPPADSAELPPSQVQQTPVQDLPAQNAPAQAEEDRKDITFLIEGQEETVRTLRHTGKGYTLYIPEEGWRFERETDDGVTEERWESIYNDEVELAVCTYPVYPDASAETTKLAFAKESGYVFEDLMGGTADDPLVGTEADGDRLCFFAAEGDDGVTYIVAWEYPTEAAEGFGVRLRVMADTFVLTGK